VTIETKLHRLAVSAGMAGLGICTADPFPDVERDLLAARSEGRSASLSFTYGDPAVSSDPRATVPWAESIVVTASPYLPQAGDPGPGRPGTGRVARFATEDHYRPLRAVLDEISAVLGAAGHRTEIRCDDNRLVDRAVAVRSGVGWWGKSSMVLAPGVGPWMLIGAVLTDARLEPSEPMVRDCGTCDACIPACPTGALIAPGVLDARRCLAAVLQSRGIIPRDLRRAVGDRWYGCDDCLTACPPGSRLAAAASHERGRVDLVEVLQTADRPLRDRHAHFYVPRNEARWLRRNAIVALANAPTADADLVLAGLAGSPDPMIRAHAVWALGEIGGARSVAALRHRAGRETDPAVAEEIELALERAVGTLE
jgi:epoxyqueuosine reductase